jgi:hypothetical protein
LRQVLQLDDLIDKLVNEATMGQTEHKTEQKLGEQENPHDHHPLMQEGGKICAKK